MAKGYKRKSFYRGSRDKYSVEQQAGALDIPAEGSAYTTVVPSTAIQGMRKVKHLTVSVANFYSASTCMYWALVYVPQGTSVGSLSVTGQTGMYEPNQYVMNCGVVDFQAGPVRFTSPVSRNLNSGDSIVLVCLNPQGTAMRTLYTVKYAVTLQ